MESFADKLAGMTDEALIEETHRLARAVSYYNAAEGNWSQETAARESVKAEFWLADSEMRKRGLEFEDIGYLL